MIDLEHLRKLFVPGITRKTEGLYVDGVQCSAPAAIEALCREVEELRARNRQLLDDRDENMRIGVRRRDLTDEHMEELRRERDELRWELEMFNRGVTAREHEIKRLKQLLFDEGWEPEDLEPADVRTTQEPAWLPAPDSKPPELADAQMVEVRDKKGLVSRLRADRVCWEELSNYYGCAYRPLYSDSGLPLCSPEGLRKYTHFVAVDEIGCVHQFGGRPKPFPHPRGGIWRVEIDGPGGWLVPAPESHRRPGPWSESLMEVMR